MSDSTVDIDQLVAEFKQRADEAGKISDEIRQEPASTIDHDALIQGVAENLATIRASVGLPSKGAGHFEQQIRQRQKSR